MKHAYSKVPTRWWLEPRFLKLKPETQRVLLAVWTAPETLLCGLTTASAPVLAQRLGMSNRAAQRHLVTLQEASFLTIDAESHLLWLHQFIEIQLGGLPSSSPAWLKNTETAVSGLPQTQMVARFREAYGISQGGAP
jgi:hypothetical protein